MESEQKKNFIWAISKKELSEKYDTDLELGLTEQVAQEKLEQEGPNEIPSASQGFLKVYLAPLFNWLIVIYFIAAIVMLIIGQINPENADMSMIYITLAIVGLNALVAIFQQARATKKLEALKELTAPTSTVIRDGQKEEILTKHIVKGDLLELNTGDRIPADARIITSINLKVNEASLTGESEPIQKNNGEQLKNKPLHLQNQENIVFYGTFIASGSCKAIVFATGAETEIGKISAGIYEAETGEIPIRTKLNNIGKWYGIGVFAVWAVVLVILYLTRGNIELIESLNSAMDIMPINIPLLTTIVMLTGVLAMADHGVIIRNLTSVDSLGRVSIVCSDKTGTLTKNEMSVQYIWTRGSHFKVSGTGYNPQGIIELIDRPHAPEVLNNLDDLPHLKILITNGYLNNNASLVKKEVKAGKAVRIDWRIMGMPTEGALKVLAHKAGISPGGKNPIDTQFEFIHEYPFSSEVKRMTKIFQHENGKYYVFTKGASEILITSACSDFLGENQEAKEFIDEMKLVIMNTINTYATKGYRILSFAYKNLDTLPNNYQEKREELEKDLIYIGFVAIMDPPREGVQEAVQTCHDAGVRVVMITGDSQPTAKAIAKQISILESSDQTLMDGSEIESINIEDNLESVRVFSRVTPQHKQDIVENYQAHNRVVAMTGDGVNDALALNMADAGVAMGIQGTDVAKESADMVISDDSFNSIVEGIKRGRGIFANIRSVVFFFVCINLFEGIVQFILAVILNYPYFLDFNMQWIFLSITLHMLPGLILTFDSISDDVMNEKPRDSEEILSRNIVILMVIYGILLAVSMLTVYLLGINEIYSVKTNNTNFGALNRYYLYTDATSALTQGVDLQIAKTLTMLMATLYFCECFLAIQIRRPNKSLIKSLKEDSNPFMYIIIGLLFAIFLSLLYIPGFQVWLARLGINFHFMRLNLIDWLIAFGCAGICIGIFELIKWWARQKEIYF